MTRKMRDQCVVILEKYRPLWFGHNDEYVDGDRLIDPYAKLTDILFEVNPEFWIAYERRDYDKVFNTPDFPEIIEQAARFWREKFYPATYTLIESEFRNWLRVKGLAS